MPLNKLHSPGPITFRMQITGGRQCGAWCEGHRGDIMALCGNYDALQIEYSDTDAS